MTTGDFAGLAGTLTGEPDQRPPLVLLHGLTFDRAMWQPSLDELRTADPRRRVLALDLPGHGGSAAWPQYDVASLTAAVNRAVTAARLDAPVLVGHSMSGGIATFYAATYPVRGVVNVDSWLQPTPFAMLAKRLAPQLRGDDFAAAWRVFEDSMHADALPAPARRLLRQTSSVRQDIVAGYWREIIERPTEDLASDIEAALAKIQAAGTSYLFIAGHEVEGAYRDWLGQLLPQARIESWPGSGHFPHLGYPGRFAACLAQTASWDGAR